MSETVPAGPATTPMAPAPASTATAATAPPAHAPGAATEVLLRVQRGDANGGQLVDYRVPVEPGMVVLDA
ncbi:MAG TPA: hypothetical protein VLV15_16980, partial [Dongiaceae bacterium]|nr:hypothetical protein [Dongiaceae bacterium]